jgi:CheY-like chemotaxis protein
MTEWQAAAVTMEGKEVNKPEPRTRILVVDDDKDIASYLGAVLTLDGYETIETHRAEQAIELIRKEPPDLVITDLMMPGLGGLGLLSYLKQDKELPFIPVIMITALHDNIDKATALEAGCDDFLSKPVNKAELQARVRSLLRLKRTNEALNRRLSQREQAQNAGTPPPKFPEHKPQTDNLLAPRVFPSELQNTLNSTLRLVEAGIAHGGLSPEALTVIAEKLRQALAIATKSN